MEFLCPPGTAQGITAKSHYHRCLVVITMNSDKKVNNEQGINVLLRDISKILFPNNPVNVPVIK
jgi:hypothetical protein